MCNLVLRLPLPGAQAADEAPHYVVDVTEVSFPEMGGHPTVFVKNQEGGPCDHLTLS